MQVSIAALKKFMEIYYGEEWCYDRIIGLNSSIKLDKSLLPIIKKISEAGITDYKHQLIPEKQYLRYDDLMLKLFCPKIKKIFGVAKLAKQWNSWDEIWTRTPNSLEQLNKVQTVFDKLSNAKAITGSLWKRLQNYHLNSKPSGLLN